MSETNTDARKAAQREQGFYWVKYQGRWHVGLWGSPSIDNWIISGKFYQDDKFDEIDETQITRQSRPATLEKVSDEEIEEAADEFYNNTSAWHGGYFTPFQAGVRWRESLSEQPEYKCLFCGENFSECGHIRAEEEQPEVKEITEGNWKLVVHNHQIADTGDYDGHYEITNGKVSFLSNEDDDESLMIIVNALNEAKCRIYLDDSDAFCLHHFKKEYTNASEIIEHRIQKTPCPNCNSKNTVPFSAKSDMCFGCGKQFDAKLTESEQVGTWMSVSEKLPDDSHGRVLVWVEEIGDLGKSVFFWNCSYDTLQGFTDKGQEYHVTHWTPVNKPSTH